MQTYTVRFEQSSKIIWILILPGFVIAPFLYLIAKYIPGLEPLGGCAFDRGIMVFILAATIYLVKLNMSNVEVTANEGKLDFNFITRSFLTPSSFTLKTGQITNFFADEYGGKYYCTIHCNVPPNKFNLSPCSEDLEDIKVFAELLIQLEDAIRAHNTKPEQAVPIANRSMYQSWWVKGIVIFAALVFVAMVVANFVLPAGSELPWYRFSVLILFGLPLALKVYQHNFKKK